MKKIVLLLTIVILGIASFAAPAKTTAAPAKAAPAASASSGLIGVSLNAIGMPSARLGMGGWTLDIGGSIANAANQTNFTVGVRAEMPLSNVNSNLHTYWAPYLTLLSAAGATTTTAGVLLGCEYMFAPNLSIFADMTALQIVSAAGATTWTISTNFGQIYTGGRLYF